MIEMLVVVAIISILAGIVLTGVTGFQAGARDTKRIADLKIVQTHLEAYAQRFGHYPGESNGAYGPVSDWAELTTTLNTVLGVRIPNDPIKGRNYMYATDGGAGEENLKYVLGARLERPNNALDSTANPQELDALLTDTEGPSGMDCLDDATDLQYCIGS